MAEVVGRLTGGASQALATPQPQAGTPLIGRLSSNSTTTGRLTMASTEPDEQAIPTNPFSFVAGLIGNTIKGGVDMVKGLGTLFVAAPVHDVFQAGANIFPGEQAIENEPSQLATIARTALPGAWFPGADLGGRYGAIATDIAHRYGGVSNIARGMYENPLSYVMDALIVADGIGLVAKAGRVGRLASLPALVSDSTASKILGPALKASDTGFELARYGQASFGSLSRGVQAGAGVAFEDALKLSKNPLMRLGQTKLYDALSMSPARTRGLFDEILPSMGISPVRAEEVTQAAERLAGTQYPGGIVTGRILRPKVGKFLAEHDQSKFMSALRVNMQDMSQAAIDELKPHIPANTPDGTRAIDYEQVYRFDQLGAPIVAEDGAKLATVDAISDIAGPGRPIIYGHHPTEKAMVFDGEANVQIAKITGQPHIIASEGPYAGAGGGTTGINSFKLTVESMDDAGRAGEDLLKKIGYDRDIRHINTLRDPNNPWDGIDVFAENAAGNTIHLTVGTPELIEAQEAAAGTIGRIAKMTEEARVLTETIPKLSAEQVKAGMAVQAAAALKKIKYDLLAAREYLKDEIFAHSRARIWEGRGRHYDPELAASWGSRPWRGKHFTERWFQMAPEEASYAKMMEAKFVDQRVELAAIKTANTAKQIKVILDKGRNVNVGSRRAVEAMNYLQIHKLLVDQGVPVNIVESILGNSGLFKARNSAETATTIASKMQQKMWDLWVKEGGRAENAGTALNDFSWLTMQAATHDELGNLVRSPSSYLPAMAKERPSTFAMRGGTKTQISSPSFFTEESTGRLFAEGRKEMDIGKAMSRAARVIYMHENVNSFLRNMTKNFARDATQAELDLAKAGDARYAGEFFFNPDSMHSLIDLRSDLAAKTILSVPETGDVLGAILRNMEEWANKVAADGLNNLNGPLKAIPEHIAKMMEREIRVQFGNSVKLFWDTPMKVWKASVLSLSPRWVVNNLFGNAIFVGLENPGAFRHVLSQFDRRNRAALEGFIGHDPIRITESGFYQEIKDLGSSLETTPKLGTKGELVREVLLGDKESSSALARMNYPSRGIQSWSRGVRSMNSYVEEAFRRGILVDELTRTRLQGFEGMLEKSTTSLQRGAQRGWTEREMATAIERVDRVIGNFMRYSPFEQGIIRRFMMPFYGFYRHMINVLLKLPFEHPLKASMFQQVQQMNEVMEGDMPSYLQGQAAVRLGDVFGTDTYLRLKNMNPLSQVTEEFGMVNLISPPIKIALERALGINTFTGETFDPVDLGQKDIFQTHDGQFWKAIRDGDGNVIDVIRTGRPLPGLAQHIGSQFGLSAVVPDFNLYKRSYEQQIASWAGIPLTQPKGGTEASLTYDQEVKAEALAQAMNNGFPEFGTY